MTDIPMDRTTPTAAPPVTMYAVVITKPGAEPVRFGPLTQVVAGERAACLRQQLPSSAPEGTTVNVEPYDPEIGNYIDPDSIPRGIDDLMPAFRDQPPGDGGANFPDLYARLVMVNGYTRAGEMWDQACHLAMAEDAVDAAVAGFEAAAVEALELVTQAAAAVERARCLFENAASTAAAMELEIPGVDHPENVAVHLAGALPKLRAAGLVLRPAGKA